MMKWNGWDVINAGLRTLQPNGRILITCSRDVPTKGRICVTINGHIGLLYFLPLCVCVTLSHVPNLSEFLFEHQKQRWMDEFKCDGAQSWECGVRLQRDGSYDSGTRSIHSIGLKNGC